MFELDGNVVCIAIPTLLFRCDLEPCFLDGNVVCIAIPMLLFRCDLEPRFLAVAVTSVVISQTYDFAV